MRRFSALADTGDGLTERVMREGKRGKDRDRSQERHENGTYCTVSCRAGADSLDDCITTLQEDCLCVHTHKCVCLGRCFTQSLKTYFETEAC